MGERKGLTKYYPPDFDPTKLPRIKRPQDGQISSHFMLPMSVRCLTCGEFMGAGLKFNAKKSTAAESYLGTKIFRFSMKCKACPASFIIKTDPEHGEYICEMGAKRNFQPWRADKEKDDEASALREEQDLDAMQALENKTLDARQEMDDLDALDELRASKARSACVSTATLLSRLRETHDAEKNIEEEAHAAFLERHATIRRIKGDDGEGARLVKSAVANSSKRRQPDTAGAARVKPAVVAKKKAKLSGLVAYNADDADSSSSDSSPSAKVAGS
jgi:Saf4/Yju2 protein